MHLPSWLEEGLRGTADFCFARLPQPHPTPEQIQSCKIISHRGEHDNRHLIENTLPAFDQAVYHGLWGIECDVRWTKDLHPVVSHDSDCLRLFGCNLKIREITLSELKTRVPLIPSLKEVIDKYAPQLHLMVEIKEEIYPDPERQKDVLKQLFSELEPGADYHFISLAPKMFQLIDFVPSQTFLPVAKANVRELSRLSIEKQYGGLTGHYALLSNECVKTHQKNGQHVGTGFVDSRNCLFRELNRGIEWVFSNNAVQLQSVCSEFLKNSRRCTLWT